LQSHILLALGVDAQADQLAKEALSAQPKLCEGTTLRYDLALRRDAVARADASVEALTGCPGGQLRLAGSPRTAACPHLTR
jgi:hypothetical protein